MYRNRCRRLFRLASEHQSDAPCPRPFSIAISSLLGMEEQSIFLSIAIMNPSSNCLTRKASPFFRKLIVTGLSSKNFAIILREPSNGSVESSALWASASGTLTTADLPKKARWTTVILRLSAFMLSGNNVNGKADWTSTNSSGRPDAVCGSLITTA